MAGHFISNAQELVSFFAWRCDDMQMALYENRAAQPGVAVFLNVFVFLRPVLASLRVVLEASPVVLEASHVVLEASHVVLEASHAVLASSQFVFALQQVVAPSLEVAVALLHVVGAPLDVVLLSCRRRRSLAFVISFMSAAGRISKMLPRDR
jgi:hypothetical protein